MKNVYNYVRLFFETGVANSKMCVPPMKNVYNYVVRILKKALQIRNSKNQVLSMKGVYKYVWPLWRMCTTMVAGGRIFKKNGHTNHLSRANVCICLGFWS